MQDKEKIQKEYRLYVNFFKDRGLVVYETFIFIMLVIFSICLYLTHSPALTCDVVQTQTWVLGFAIGYPIPAIVPISIYSVIKRKKLRTRNTCNLIRIGSSITFLIFLIVYSAIPSCRLYVNLHMYQLIILLSTILPILVIITAADLRKAKKKARAE